MAVVAPKMVGVEHKEVACRTKEDGLCEQVWRETLQIGLASELPYYDAKRKFEQP